ncbi:MAG TPA: DEAD/DEAH box helicase [Syntrophales bacterium]|nr:DEAD/DEAH box helicase [Syntrophales bacterium]
MRYRHPKRFDKKNRFRGKRRSREPVRLQADAEPVLKGVFAKIGKPVSAPFSPDVFQLQALAAIKRTDCLVIAPTGSGKTWIAEQAILSVFSGGGRCWYASPLKALTNAKWVEFGLQFEAENVGILTGDTKENTAAPIIVGTTEILRNQLYDVMHSGEDMNCDLVILDEAHFLGDGDRGVVWEEVMIYLPARINLLLLSATIGNGEEIALWLSTIRGKECVVIKEERRPVPLYPLFFHPTGRIMPYLEKKRLFSKVNQFYKEEQKRMPHRGKMPPFGEIIRVLGKYQLLPAIFFLKSRSECDAALKTCGRLADSDADDTFYYTLEETISRFPYLGSHKQLHYLTESRVASHHAGQLPSWKFLVETMMKSGHLQAIFATSTVAAGVNFPARTIVLFNSDLFNGREFDPLKGTEFHQMTGRAGRRGLDKIGFLLVVPGRFMDLEHIRRLLFKRPEDIESQIKNDFSMVLNLLLSQTPEDIRNIFENSLAIYQHAHGKKGRREADGLGLWDDFQRHLDFLKAENFVDENSRLTENGAWASKLRLDQPILIAECLKRNVLPADDANLLAAAIAPFVYDGDQNIRLTRRTLPRKLSRSYSRIVTTLQPLSLRMKDAGFRVSPLYLWTSAVIYDWARGIDWGEIIEMAGISDGDMAMLVLRTADNLWQIRNLKDTHPQVANLAAKAREAILREPVIFE